MEGFKLTDGPTRYTPQTLFEYIDGGADSFLAFDFEELSAATYESAQKVSITADLYRHRDATRAFGIYSQERPAGTTALPVGTEGHAGSDYLLFVSGAYYVKLSQAGPGPSVLRAFADKIAARLPGPKEAPPVLKLFPDKGKRARAEKLTAKDFLGHAFLHDGATAPYELDGAHFRLFVAQGKDEADAREMVTRLLALAKATTAFKPEGSATIKDPLNGEMLLQWKGRWLWGAVDEGCKLRQALVEELGRSVVKSLK